MVKVDRRVVSATVLAIGMSIALLPAHAFPLKFKVVNDHTNLLYRCGEEAVFTVTALETNGVKATAGEVKVTLDNFGPKNQLRRKVDLAKENPFVLRGKLDEPGFLCMTATAAGQKHFFWSVGYEPERLEKGSPSPEDFDAFWANARAKLAREVPLDPQIVKIDERSTSAFTFYRVSFATFGRRVHGYMSVPTDRSKAPYPVEFQVSAAGFGGWTNNMDGSPNAIQLFFAVYPFEPHWNWEKLDLKSKYDALNRECQEKYGTGYSTAGIAVSREEYFFYPVLLGIDRAVDWVAARPDVDSRHFWYQGTSQGGGFGFYLTGLNHHFTRAAFFVPAITDTMGYLKGRQSGWPRIIESQKKENRSAAEKNAPYFDGANFAARIRCPVRVAVGFADVICAPCAVYSAYNAIKVKDKGIVHGFGMGHGCFREFYDSIGAWLRRVEPVDDPGAICWGDGTWDRTGAPKGALLSDNPHWYGRRIFTGMTYTYESAPNEPADILDGNASLFGNRLKGGRNYIRGSSFVGLGGNRPIVAVFDFKRPCTFNEVDVYAPFCTNATGTVEFSADGKAWSTPVPFVASARFNRVRFAEPGHGRYLRLAYKVRPGAVFALDSSIEDRDHWLRERMVCFNGKLQPGYTYLQEVYVWGEGEVSDRYPEDVRPLEQGNALAFTGAARGGVSILPMRTPHLDRKPSGATPPEFRLRVARNETESRYFAVVNGTDATETIALVPPDFGEGTASELLIGGVIDTARKRRKLTDAEMAIMATTNREFAASVAAESLDVVPFFFAGSLPYENQARKYLANPRQVLGFPSAVELKPGDGCVVMLRVATASASGIRRGVFRAGATELPIALDVLDVELPPQRNWMYAYEPFTQQFPYETPRRMWRDAERFVGSGANCVKMVPEAGTKERIFFDLVKGATIGYYPLIDRELHEKLRLGKFTEFTDEERALALANVRRILHRARQAGVKPEDVILFLPDEPRIANARSTMELAKFIKENIPEAVLNCNPLFHEGPRGFLPDADILGALLPHYNKYIDCSSPMAFIAGSRPKLMKELWTQPRRINAQYNHPGGRMGRGAAFAAFRDGLNGHAYYCYHDDLEVDNPWAPDAWGLNDYWYQTVYPLENDVALTPLYEIIREAGEDYRLLAAVRSAGRNDVLDSVFRRFDNGAWDRCAMNYRACNPQAEDILDLRDALLDALAKPATSGTPAP